MKNRVIRIMPLYWFVYAVILAVYFVRPEFVNSSSGEPRLIHSLFLLTNDHFFLVNIGWTLSHEFYFYLLFVMVLPFQRSVGLSLILRILLATTVLGWAMTFLDDWEMIGLNKTIFSDINLEFGYGILIAIAFRRGHHSHAGLSIVLATLWFAALTTFPALHELTIGRGLLYGFPAAAFVYGLVSLEAQGRYRASAFLRYLGDISYSTYLTHLLVLSGVGLIWSRLGLKDIVHDSGLIIAWVLAVLVTASITYKFVERPLISFCKSKFGNTKPSGLQDFLERW